jgi:hypothetical protein
MKEAIREWNLPIFFLLSFFERKDGEEFFPEIEVRKFHVYDFGDSQSGVEHEQEYRFLPGVTTGDIEQHFGLVTA